MSPPSASEPVVAPAAPVPAQPRGWERLTVTQRRVLQLIAQGRTTGAIAVELGASPHTVQAHRVHIGVRLGIRGRNALQKFALEHMART